MKKTWLTLFVLFAVGCSADAINTAESGQDNKQELPVDEIVAQPVLPNGVWALVANDVLVEGDHIRWSRTSSYDAMGNISTSVHFALADSSDDMLGRLVGSPDVAPSTSGSADVFLFAIEDSNGDRYFVDQSGSVNVASIAWSTSVDVALSIQGDGLIKIDSDGTEEEIGEFEFDLETELTPGDPTQQLPIPLNERGEGNEPAACPSWTFDDDPGTKLPNLPQAQRSSGESLSGSIVKSAVDPGDGDYQVLKLQSIATGTHQMYGGEIFIEGPIPEGYTGTWPVAISTLTMRVDDIISWQIVPDTISLDVISWDEGLMTAEFSGNGARYFAFDMTSGQLPYIEEDVDFEGTVVAPHPNYSDSYLGLCDSGDDDYDSWVAKCEADYDFDYGDCQSQYPDDPQQRAICYGDASSKYGSCLSECPAPE